MTPKKVYFRSFPGEQELSLVPIPFKGQALNGVADSALAVAAIYGANASGKTNVLRAMEFMKNAVVESHSSWRPDGGVPRQPFAGSEPGLPSRFVMDFELDRVRHQYGFAATSTTVEDEWLHVFPKGKRQVWFSRQAGIEFSFGARLKGENETIRTLTRRNSLFLSAAAQNNHEQLSGVYQWFSRHISVLVGDREKRSRSLPQFSQDPASVEQLRRYLNKADLGIVDVSFQRHIRLEFHDGIEIHDAFTDALPNTRDNSLREDVHELKLLHKVGGKAIPFESEQESDGTLAYLDLFGPTAEMMAAGGLLCIDELDASIHPLLVADIIKLFQQRSNPANPAQLLFTAHNTNPMGILNRDQIWFTEKDSTGASHLYPLSDFKPRRQENLELGYVQGRYGAIPFIGAASTFAAADEADESVR